MKWLVRLSINRPRTVIAVILAITLFFAVMLGTRFSINVDPMKAFSRKMEVIKYYHLTLKKFSMKDMILIGIENEKEGVVNVSTLRYIERMTNEFKNLTVKKTYNNIITGKKETVEVPSKLSAGQIVSIINADTVRVDRVNNAIVMGNLTSKAREKAGLVDQSLEVMKELPKSDADLAKMMPYLEKELQGNDLLRGTLYSSDGKACALMVPVEKRIDNKLEIIRRELPIMVSAEKLRDRFKGGDWYFPAVIYNKKVDGTMIDDAFIQGEAASGRKKARSFLLTLLKPIGKYNQGFYDSLRKNEVNDEYLTMVFKVISDDAVYEKPDVNLTYQDCVDDLYKFVIESIDRFSRNNLEAKLYNVPNIYDVGYIYKIFNSITEKNKPAELKIFIAGMPVAEAILEEFVMNDMSIFMTLCTVVILAILFMTIRTPTGIYLPLVGVTISIIWLMGGMLMLGVDISSGTMAMPSILIAVGSSYVIHFLVRYYEKIAGKTREDVKEVLINTTDSIDTAITLSAITTMAAFTSNMFMDIVDIQRLGILVTLGFFMNLVFTFTFVPACLVLQPPPRGPKESIFERVIMKAVIKGGENTARHSRAVFWGAVGVTAVFFVGMFALKTESSISSMFLEKNPIRKADKFINKELTGTGQMCIVFKMRDRVSLRGSGARKDLAGRIDGFTAAYGRLLAAYPGLASAGAANDFFVGDLKKMKNDPERNRDAIEERVSLFADIMNEFYEPEKAKGNDSGKTAVSAQSDEISALADDLHATNGGPGSESSQNAGIEDIISRIKPVNSDAGRISARQFILSLRQCKNTMAGKEFQGAFYYLSDFFNTDVTQPITIRKIDELGEKLKNLKEPAVTIDGVTVKPVGNVMSITDTLKLIYKVFYHDDNDAFKKIPNVREDGIMDKSLTDRSIIGVCINQFRGSREDVFKYLVTDDMKLMQYVVFMRSDKADFLRSFQKTSADLFKKTFPEDDPYVEKIVMSGMPAINLIMNDLILYDQIKSIIVTVFIVFLCCLFMFRSFMGALFATVPISFTLAITLGVMGYLGIPINYSTLINASIAVGAGIDFSIHFIERFKIEYNINRLDFKPAYINTLKTTGVAIVTATLTMGLGFAVLGFSSFKIIKVSGLLVTLSMILSGTLSLTVLPAMMIWLKPSFLRNARPWGLEEKITVKMNELKGRYREIREHHRLIDN